MNVEQIMTKDVATCGPDDTLNEAARMMWERDCGFVPIAEPGPTRRLVGIVTDRDLCMAAYTRGRSLGEIRVGDVMSTGVRSCKAADDLASSGVDATVWDVRCCAPLDAAMIADAAAHGTVLTFEDGIREGGIGMMIADRVGALQPEVPVHVFGVPTKFIPHAKPDRILAQLGLDADGIARSVRDLRA